MFIEERENGRMEDQMCLKSGSSDVVNDIVRTLLLRHYAVVVHMSLHLLQQNA